jgi:hypothetical protein
LTKTSEWRHIPTSENPADIISRGLMPNQLKDATLWWYGPQFLQHEESTWPDSKIPFDEAALPEMKSPTTLVSQDGEQLQLFTKYSSFIKLQRVTANLLRFVFNCKNKTRTRGRVGVYQQITAEEMTNSLKCIIRGIQMEEFRSERRCLEKGEPVCKKSLLYNLNTFIDQDRVIRVGGRLRHSSQHFDVKHQYVLPKNHHVTTILIRSLHQNHGHAGQQALLAIVRQTFWPIGAKTMVRQITKSCVVCYKFRPKSINQFMGDLPAARVTGCFPFFKTGIDYAGPVTLKLTRRTSTKAYIALFVCMATKAVHIELVSDLSTKAFLAALTRFTSRRGHCKDIFCDNATNFVGAKNEVTAINNLLASSQHQEEVLKFCANQIINFHFIPPRAPHFGGLWEAAVKSMKYHFNRIVGTTQLTFEEMCTIITKIEAILNSRPLIPESSDAEDVNAITPGHFLIGRPLTALPEPVYEDVTSNRLHRWQLLQKMTQHFWKKWSRDYLTTLQNRTKSAGQSKIIIGMLVLVREDNLPPTQWLVGRIVQLHPGQDGIVRVVSLKTKNGIYKRPVVKICVLPIPTDNTDGDDE